MTIRPVCEKDIPILEELYQRTRQHTFSGRPLTDFQIVDYAKSTDGEQVWVAEEDAEIVGFVSVYRENNFIHNLFVRPDFQHKGVGSALLHRAESALASPMTLKIALDNIKVCAFYEKHGWVKVSLHENEEEPYALYRKR